MKKSLKNVLAAALAVLMLVTAVPFASAAASTVNPFTDVSEDDYFFDAVIWAYSEGITTGTTATKFAPASTCTRGQVVTFLWRAMGEPDAVSSENPFEDVKESDYFYKAVLWAVEKEITTGTSAKRFSPDVTCTNAHIITFIWRAMGEPEKTGNGEWYDDAIVWAENGGLLGGTYEGEFDPSGKCPRANVVTYLYRYLSSGVKMIFVSTSGNDETADGSAVNPYRTITAARNAIRGLNKSEYSAIRVRIGAGEYNIRESIDFLTSDSGTKSCPITYSGEDGTIICGGVAFDSSDFAKADGSTMQYFPEEVRESLVMIDLKQFGFGTEDISSMVKITRSGGRAPLAMNGSSMTVARYPNGEYAETLEGSRICSENGEKDAIDWVTDTVIYFDAEHMDHVKSWHDLTDVYTLARYSVLWCDDSSGIRSINTEENFMTVPFTGGHDPRVGMPFYWYNIPEELDTPGEYYIDQDCVLYFYPTEDFEGAHFTMPVIDDSLVTINGAEYLTFSNLTFEATRRTGISGDDNHLTIKNCTVRSCSDCGIRLVGDEIMVSGCEVYSIGNTGISVTGGDEKTLRLSDDIVYNNYVHEWSTGIGLMNYAISVGGCGVTVSHNECVNSVDMGIDYSGPYHTIEYNYCGDTCQFFGDGGVIGSGALWAYGTVVRYNYVKNGGFTRDTNIDFVGVQGITVDMGQSGLTAYGNVIENVTGSGFGICGGRDHSIYGNLMICCKAGMFYDSRFYADIIRNKGGNRISADNAYTTNKNWTKAFPVLAKMTFYNGSNFDKVTKDKNFNAAPVATVKNNVYYLDKATHDRTMIHDPYSIENYVYDFADIETPSVENGKLYSFSSKREPYNIEECVIANSGTIAITIDQFRQIGRVK